MPFALFQMKSLETFVLRTYYQDKCFAYNNQGKLVTPIKAINKTHQYPGVVMGKLLLTVSISTGESMSGYTFVCWFLHYVIVCWFLHYVIGGLQSLWLQPKHFCAWLGVCVCGHSFCNFVPCIDPCVWGACHFVAETLYLPTFSESNVRLLSRHDQDV